MFRYIVLLLSLLPTLLPAQLYDYQWVMGIGPNNPADMEGGTLMDFHATPVSISYRPLATAGRTQAFTNICNAEGILQLYTNNCSIINEQDIRIQGGNGLNAPGADYEAHCGSGPNGGGYNTRSSFFLPMPGSSDNYVLFHLRYDFPTTPEYFYHVESLLYSVVDAAAANGQGALIQKNILLAKDTLCDMLAAVRHGNGRDWWVVCPQFNSDQSFVCLLTPEGVQGPYLRTTPLFWGGELNNFWWEQAVFSSDGQRYARANNRNDIQVFDFDRCTGEFSHPLHLALPMEAKYTCGLALSRNGRFVYTSTGVKVYQFDLAASDPQSSRVLIAEYDAETDPLATTFNAMQLAPDGKIYVTNTNGMYLLTVINNPDAPGLACNLVQHGVELPSKIGLWVPNFPNFRLYGLEEGPCDTLTTALYIVDKPISVLSVAPNPAQDLVQFGYVGEQVGQLQIFDAAGRLVWSQITGKGSHVCQVAVSDWEPGFYQATLYAGREVARQRFVVNR